MPADRSTREVLDDHLELARAGRVEEDLQRNYASDVVCFFRDGLYRGHDGVRELARRLAEELPDPSFAYTTVLTDGEVAFLEWTGRSEYTEVGDGADSFVLRDGRISAQTIHYTVVDRPSTPAARQAPTALHSPAEDSGSDG